MSYKLSKPFLAALFHDIGKLDRKILGETKKSHQFLGYEFFKDVDREIATIIRYHHHEREGLNLDPLDDVTKLSVEIVKKADRFVSSETREGSEREISSHLFYPPWFITEILEGRGEGLSERNAFGYSLYHLPFVIGEKHKESKQLLKEMVREIKEGLKKYLKANLRNLNNSHLYTILTVLREITFLVQSYQQSEYPHSSLYTHLYMVSLFSFLIGNKHEEVSLVVIEASGIQQLISKILEKDYTSKGAAKIFRGRSLFVEAITDLLALEIVEAAEVPLTSITSISSGKIHLLIPTEKVGIVKEKIEKLNEYLRKNNFFPFRFNFGVFTFSLDIENKRFLFNGKELKWEEIIKKAYRDLHANSLTYNISTQFLELGKNAKLCEVCGELSEEIEEKITYVGENEEEKLELCPACLVSFNIGDVFLKKSKEDKINSFVIFSFYEKEKLEKAITIDGFNLSVFVKSKEIGKGLEKELDGRFNKVIPLVASYRLGEGNFFSFIKDSFNKTGFNYLFPLSNSVKLLDKFTSTQRKYFPSYYAFVKMDVDNLGKIYKKVSKVDLSKPLELSEILSWYLRQHISYILSEKKYLIYPVYIGGDDILIAGDLKDMYNFVIELNKRMKDLTNGEITLSSTYLLVGKGTPMRDIFMKLENYIKEAKNKKKKGDPGLTFSFIKTGEKPKPYNLSEFIKLENATQEFLELLGSDEKLPTSFIHNLIQIKSSKYLRNSRKIKMMKEYLEELAKAKEEYVKRKRKLENIVIPDIYALYLGVFLYRLEIKEKR